VGLFDRTLFERLTERSYQRMRAEAETELTALYQQQSNSFTDICARLSMLGTLTLVYSPDLCMWRASCDQVVLKHLPTGVVRNLEAADPTPDEAVQLYWTLITSITPTDRVIAHDEQSYRWSEESKKWVTDSDV